MSTQPERQAPSIFVNYRIADTLPMADRLAAELQRTFGAEAVFFDRRTIDPGEEALCMHRLLRDYVRSGEGAEPAQLARFRAAHAAAFLATAKAVSADPADSALVADLLCYPLVPERWSLAGDPLALSGSDCHSIGYGLSKIGLFDEARPWSERAVAEAEQGEDHGRVDHASLGRSLHQVGYCLSETGDYAGARPWYERAVAEAEAEQGDVHGRVDHESLEVSKQALDRLSGKGTR